MSRRNTELLLLIASAFPVILLYAMYVLTAGAAISFETLAVPIGLFAAFAAAHIAVRILAPGADPAILPIVFVLSGIGITFVTRLAPALAISQLIILFVSVALMVGTLALVKNLDVVMRYKYTFGIIGIILLMLPIFIGTTISGSKLWIRIAGFTIQPGEFAKVFIVLFLAGYLAENRELLSISNRKILGLKIPRFRLLLPLFAVWGVCLLIVVFERDLGSAVLFYTIFLLMLYVATGRFSYVIIGLALLAVGAVGAYKFLSHVQVRFQVWVDPFKDAQGQGYQIVQSLYSLADGGLVGVGIGNGMANTIPVVESDFIFSAIGEEMGLLGGGAVLILFMLFAVRGLTTAARAKSDLAAFSATGLTAAISFQAFLIVGGVTRLIPLTGVTLPFMSQGGSSLLASFIIVALLLRAGHQRCPRELRHHQPAAGLRRVVQRRLWPGGQRDWRQLARPVCQRLWLRPKARSGSDHRSFHHGRPVAYDRVGDRLGRRRPARRHGPHAWPADHRHAELRDRCRYRQQRRGHGPVLCVPDTRPGRNRGQDHAVPLAGPGCQLCHGRPGQAGHARRRPVRYRHRCPDSGRQGCRQDRFGRDRRHQRQLYVCWLCTLRFTHGCHLGSPGGLRQTRRRGGQDCRHRPDRGARRTGSVMPMIKADTYGAPRPMS